MPRLYGINIDQHVTCVTGRVPMQSALG